MKHCFTTTSSWIKFVFACIFSMSFFTAPAQLPICSGTTGGIVYLLVGNSIYNYDPTSPIVTGVNPVLNTIAVPAGSNGLAVSPNLNSATPAVTFYTVVGNIYYYYNGTGWTNTGHTAGAVNPGAGGGYIYSLEGGSGNVYRYDGTGNATLVVTIAGFNGGGPYDLVVDCEGNFYALYTSTPSQWLKKYSPTGVLLQTWVVNGIINPTTAGGGLAIVGNTIYYHNNSPAWVTGTIDNNNSTVTINNVGPGLGTYSPSDVASCPLGGIASVMASIDTGYYCGTGPGIPVTATGTAPFSWEVVSGPAVITGSGSSITVTATSNAKIRVYNNAAQSACGGANSDTVTIIVPTATVNAGGDDTLNGCGTYKKVLSGSLLNTMSFITYNIAWTPAATVTAGGTTLTPTVEPTANTNYYLTVSTPANKGGCVWKDSVNIAVKDRTVNADFSSSILYGCGQDTVNFTNLSTANIHYLWNFGDNTSPDTNYNATHVYGVQNTYSVELKINNGFCRDSVTKTVDLLHPLSAAFTVDKDSVCQQGTVTFTNTSTTTTINNIAPTYFWDFGDGGTATTQNPAYQFNNAGTYKVMMVVTDFVPCTDTAWQIIQVDSIPEATVVLTDSLLCEGQNITFSATYVRLGNKDVKWDFGDGYTILNQDKVTHAYDDPGAYNVLFTASYRICNDLVVSKPIDIKAHPVVNVGPDTAFCPNAAPLYVYERYNASNPAAHYRWNTGDSSTAITVHGPGIYAATVTVDGCSAADSLEVVKDCYIDIPNVFTPDGDGENDYFFPRQLLSRSVSRFSLSVFNRWGQVVFQTTNINGRGWDGKFNGIDQPSGVFIYQIEADFTNGVKEKYQGNVSLLR